MAKITGLVFYLACYFTVFAQVDTLEIIESDTAIIYVIEDEPVTIRDTVSYFIQPPKLYTRIGTFVSVLHNGFQFREVKGNEAYFAENQKYLSNELSYSIGMFVWNCPKRFAKGIGVNLLKLRQKFEVKDSDNANSFSITNVTSLIHIQVHLGYKYSWKRRWNFIPEISPGIQYNLSLTGYVVDPNNYNSSYQVQITYFPKKISPMISLDVRNIYSFQGLEFELVPYISYMPFNILKAAPVRYNGYVAGVRLGMSHKLF